MFPPDTDFESKVTLENQSMPVSDELPFRILFLGDWSGRESRSLTFEPMNLRPIEIDRDNFDDVMRRMRVGIDLDFQGNAANSISLEFTEIDDFHPDRIFQRLPLFANLRDIRKRLINPNTFNEAAREVYSWLSDTEEEKKSETITSVTPLSTNQSASNNLLDQILDETPDKNYVSDIQTNEKSELSELVSRLVKPHLIQTDEAEQSKLLLIVDEVTSDLMRKIIQHPQFQSLESAWRGAYFLVRRVETDTNLKIYLLDISKDEVSNDLKSVNDLTDSILFRIIKFGNVESSDKEPWAVFGGNYTFSLNIDDVASLIRLAKIANDTNTPFISHFEPEMFDSKAFGAIKDSDSLNESYNSQENKLWTTLRSLPESTCLGLTFPRFLARLPYGEQTEPTESFYFEEFLNSPQHDKYLWANPTFACLLLLAQTYSEYGWNISKNLFLDIPGLPVHLYTENDEAKIKSCIEIPVTENNYQQLISQGLMPLISFRNTDMIRLGGFQSIANPSSILRGKWN